MDLSSLPKYHDATTADQPVEAAEQPASRPRTMLLQAAFLVAVWSGIYILHQQAAVFATWVEQDAAKKRFEGIWQSDRWPGMTFEFHDGKFRITRAGERWAAGEYHRSGQELSLAVWSGLEMTAYWKAHYRATGDELVIWGTDEFRWGVFLRWLGRKVTGRVEAEDRELRLVRVGE
jgi:hypothetical protein